MAEINLLFRPIRTQVGGLTLDAAVEITHSAEVEVTDHAVEVGANISDHARPKPITLTIDGLISNTPVSLEQAKRVRQLTGFEFVSTAPSESKTRSPGYAEQAFSLLENLRTQGALLSVVTPMRSYDNLVITSLSVPQSARTGEALSFKLSLKQIRLVSNNITDEVVTREPKAKPKKDAGAKAGEEVPENAKQPKSWLADLNDVVGDPLNSKQIILRGGI